MLSALLALSLISQSAHAASPPVRAARPTPGTVQVLIRMDVPEIPLSKDRTAFEAIEATPGANVQAALHNRMREQPDRWFSVTGPLRVRVLSNERDAHAEHPREFTQVDILEGPSKGKVGWTLRPFLTPPNGLENLLAVPYEDRTRRWSEYLAQAHAPAKGAPSQPQKAKALIEKRRQKKAARYKATLAREAAEARANAEAKAQARQDYKEALPYLMQPQGQMLRRQSQIEADRIQEQRNQILMYFLWQNGYQNSITPASSPVPASH